MDPHHPQNQIKKFNEENEPTNCFVRLPKEIASDILSRLPITSLIPFTFVSRSLNFSSHNPYLANMHLSRSSTNGSSCIILHSLGKHLHFIQLTTDEKTKKLGNIPFASYTNEFGIIGSSNGLLCLIDKSSVPDNCIYIYNPFTRDYLNIPKNPDSKNDADKIVLYGFGHHPITDDCKVIKISYHPNFLQSILASYARGSFRSNNEQMSDVQVYSLRKNAWKSIGAAPYRLEKWSSPGILVHGRIHWVSKWSMYDGEVGRIIVSYDLADDSFNVVPKPYSSGRWADQNCHLAALRGCLSAIIPNQEDRGKTDIWIMKEYGVRKSWVKEYTILVYNLRSLISHFRTMSRPMTTFDHGVGIHELVNSLSMRSDEDFRQPMFPRKYVHVVCALKNGELILEYNGRLLLLYDPNTGNFKEWKLEGMPRIFQATLHVGSLKSAASTF